MAKLPQGAKIKSIPSSGRLPAGAKIKQPVNQPGRFVPEPFTRNEEQPTAQEMAGVNPITGTLGEFAQGVSFNLGDEIQAAMAALTVKAAPLWEEDFISDKTLGQIYTDAITQIRAKQREFREQNPGAAMTANILGSVTTGGAGISRLAPKAHPFIGGAGVGAVEGGIAGVGAADADEFYSLDTAVPAMIGAGVGAVGGFVFPIAQSLAVQGAKALPKAAKSLFTTKSALKRKYISQLESGEGLDDDMAKYIIDGAGKLRKNDLLPEMVNQGWHPGTANMVAGAKPADRKAFNAMLDLVERGRKNRAFAKSPANHPRAVVGKTALKRLLHIKNKNKEASEEIGRIAREELKGSQINLEKQIFEFEDVLANNGLVRGETFGVNPETGRFFINFDNTPFTPKDRGPIREVLKQMERLSVGGADAADAHDLKRIIDNNITWGKGDSMSHDAANMLKGFRIAVDEVLDTTFPNYNAANTQYKDTIEVLEDVVDLMGKRIDLDNPKVDQSLGRELRKVFGNTKVAEGLTDLIEDADEIAARYGGEFGDSTMAQLHFFDDLSERLGPFEGTSFRAETGRGTVDALRKMGQGDRTVTGVVLDMGDEIVKKAENISDEGALEVMQTLINQVDKMKVQ